MVSTSSGTGRCVQARVDDRGERDPPNASSTLFFSTKGESGGTGLGLSVSRFIVADLHGGEMSVASRVLARAIDRLVAWREREPW